jgi:plasmid replication initiation protein
LKQYENIKGWWWWKVTLNKLKTLLGVEENKSYNRYSNFKQKVILIAQKELEEKTDIKFKFEEQKKGRKIDVITFYILPNKKANNSKKEPTKTVPKELPKITKNESYKILSEKLKIDEKFIEEIYKTYDEKRILENAKHTLKEFQKGSIKSSIGGFLREALKHNFANQKSLLSLQEEQKEIKKREELKKQKIQEEKQKREEKLKQGFQKNITQKVEKYISENEDNLEVHYNKFKEKFAFALWNETDIKKAINENIMTKNFFINFLSKKILDKKELDFEQFKRSK